jgi:hypothetical protein
VGENSNKVPSLGAAEAVTIFLAGLKESVKEAVAEAVREERRAFIEAEPELCKKLSAINAKVNITVPEAALLLGCSDSHLYKLIKDAEQGKRERPIPYLDLDGVKVLPREQLLEWARPK